MRQVRHSRKHPRSGRGTSLNGGETVRHDDGRYPSPLLFRNVVPAAEGDAVVCFERDNLAHDICTAISTDRRRYSRAPGPRSVAVRGAREGNAEQSVLCRSPQSRCSPGPAPLHRPHRSVQQCPVQHGQVFGQWRTPCPWVCSSGGKIGSPRAIRTSSGREPPTRSGACFRRKAEIRAGRHARPRTKRLSPGGARPGLLEAQSVLRVATNVERLFRRQHGDGDQLPAGRLRISTNLNGDSD
jgi:hypothetical protein